MGQDKLDPVIAKTNLENFTPLPQGIEQYPIEYMETNSVIKLKETENVVTVGICEPENIDLLTNLKNFHKKTTVFYRLDKSELASYLSTQMAREEQDSGSMAQDEKLLLDKLANDAPIVNLVNSIFIDAIRKNASDIHLECFSQEMIVRYRMDGYLSTVRRLEKDRFAAVSTRIKIMANLNILEKRLPQDGRITVHLDNDIVDLRVSIVPISEGESIVLRLFNKKRSPLTLTQLGLEDEPLGLFRQVAQYPNGLILVTGPTGSGKTTTLNAILQEIKNDSLKIISIEDPIEYVNDGVDQIQTNETIGLTFDSILRRVLRQDPNIIMVGEIRDRETANLTIRAALTGHLVFSTLHTQDAVSVVTRLTNMGIEPYLLAAVLKCSMAQRLVRRICPDCKTKKAPHTAEKSIFEKHGLKMSSLYYGKGCEACLGTGYRGRVGIFEIFAADAVIEDMIANAQNEAEIRTYLKARKMCSLIQAGLVLTLKGETTLHEVERAALA